MLSDFSILELLSRLELPNLFLTKEALYQLSYNSTLPTNNTMSCPRCQWSIPLSSTIFLIFFFIRSPAL